MPQHSRKDLTISQPASKTSKPQRGRKVVSDESEDEVIAPAVTKPPRKVKNTVNDVKHEETTSSAYFASNSKSKPSRSTPIRSKPTAVHDNGFHTTPTKSKPVSTPSSTGRRSGRKISVKNYAEDDEFDAILKHEKEGHDDIFADEYKPKGGQRGEDDYQEDTEDEAPKPKSRATNEKRQPPRNGTVKASPSEDEDSDLEMAEIPRHDGTGERKPKTPSGVKSSGRKRKSKDVDGEDDVIDDDEDKQPKKKIKKSIPKDYPRQTKSPTKKEPKEENKEIQAVFDSIPTVRAPTPPPRDASKKFVFGQHNNTTAAPPGAGSKDIPDGAENCLAGLSFVFTGVLESLGREEGQNLVKRYGGKVTTAPSSKTSFVVLGTDAGPKKLETIAKLGLKTINEDGLFELIKKLPANGGDGLAAERHAEKKAKEEEKIRADALEMDRKEREATREAPKAPNTSGNAVSKASQDTNRPSQPKIDDRLWVDKYSPDSINAVCGNKGLVEGLQKWLRMWHKNAEWGFKKAGADGKGIYRAAMLHGPPGIGKTTAAHLVAKLEGFDVLETNASDTRSKRLVEEGLRGVLDTTSILGYFAGDGKKVQSTKKNLVLIMDEVDGMSAGDRGGVGALAAVAKKTNIPMILICNERRLPKMKPFDFVCADFPFRRPTVDNIRGRIMTICYREGIKMPGSVIDALIEGSHADIRQIINMISTVKLDNKTLDFNNSKAMAKAWEKHVILKPWDIVGKILSPQMFASSSTATLNDKIELYFNDHEFSYLMLQENYLKTQPALASAYHGQERSLKLLDLAEKAASSISDGDLVDRMIHGSQQHWSLMPTHAVFSFVTPASNMYGNFTERVGFASWLGQNSRQGTCPLTSCPFLLQSLEFAPA